MINTGVAGAEISELDRKVENTNINIKILADEKGRDIEKKLGYLPF